MPFPAQRLDFAVCPDGTRVAYVCGFEDVSVLGRLLHRLFNGNHHMEALCVCKLDGSEFRELGRVTDASLFIQNGDWQPGGGEVSFVCNGALYVVPVN